METLVKNSSPQINNNSKDSLITSTFQKSPEISLESGFNDQSIENSFYISDNEISNQSDLDLILNQDNINEYSIEVDPKTSNQLLEDNKKLVAENLKLRTAISEMKKSQNASTIDSLKSEISKLNSQLQKVTAERDELKLKVIKLSEDINIIKDPHRLDKIGNGDNNEEDDIYDSGDHLININKEETKTDNNTIIKDSDILDAIGLIENMINSQSKDISLISNQKNALFQITNKLIESNKELENQLADSAEYVRELEKNHIDLEQKCIELQEKNDNEMDYLLTSIINLISTYPSVKRSSKKSNKTMSNEIIESFNKKVQQKLSQIQDQTLNSQIIELFKLTINKFYETIDDLSKANTQNQTLGTTFFNSSNSIQQNHTRKELALLGHLENAIRYVQELTNTSKTSLREDERTYIIAQVSRIANFIDEEIDIERISNYTSLFNHANIESQILAFFDFVNKEEEEDSDDDRINFSNDIEEEEEEIKNEEEEKVDKLQLIKKKEMNCMMIKNTPVRELYNLFKAVVVVNSIMFDHFDRVAEEMVQLKTELSSMKESKSKYEQQYNKMAQHVDEMSSEIGRFFFSIQQQEQKKLKNNRTGKNKKTKNANKNEVNKNDSINAYADDPFLAVSHLIDMLAQSKEENAKQKKMIKNLNKTVSQLNKKEEANNKIEELEAHVIQLKSENDELKEKYNSMIEMTKENNDLKNEVNEALKKVEMLQIKSNKMKEKKKEEEDKTANLTQQLQMSEVHNRELRAQFDNLKEIATKSTNMIKSYKDKEKRLISKIISLEEIVSQSEKNETTKQREINEAKKLHMLQSKQNEETKEKYELQIKQLNNDLQTAQTKIQQMEEEASTMTKSKENLLRDIAKLKLIERTLEMKLKQQETHSVSIVNIERGKCESKILMAKSQIEECLSEHEKRLTKIKFQLLQIVREFFPESYTAAVRSATVVPSISSTETALNNVFSRSPNRNSVSEISLPTSQLSPSILDYASNQKNTNFTSPHNTSNQTETPNSKPPIFSFLSPPSQQNNSSSPHQFSSPTTLFTSQYDSSPFASLDMLCDSVEASLDSVRECVSRSDFHNNASTVQEANKVRAQLGMKSSGSLLKKFTEMNDRIDDLEATNNLYKDKYNKCAKEKQLIEKELIKNDPIRCEIQKWEKWSRALFRQITNELSFTSPSSTFIGATEMDNSSSFAAILNDSDDSDLLELKDLTTGTVKKPSPFRVIPLISSDEIRAALEESVLASIGHRAMLRKIGVLRVQKRVIFRAYQNLFELIRPIITKVKNKEKGQNYAALAMRKLKRNYNYFFCFMLNSNVRFCQLNDQPPNSQYALCSIRHLILIYVFLKRIEKCSGFTTVVGSNSITASKEIERRSSLIDLDD